MRGDGRRETGEEAMPDIFFLLAFGTIRILTRLVISTLSSLPTHPVAGQPGGEIPNTSSVFS